MRNDGRESRNYETEKIRENPDCLSNGSDGMRRRVADNDLGIFREIYAVRTNED